MYEYVKAFGAIPLNFDESTLDRNSRAYQELYTGSPSERRATGRSCGPSREVPVRGTRFISNDWTDGDRYRQAGCIDMGAARHTTGIRFSSDGSRVGPTSTYTDSWCCPSQSRVEEVFREWTESPGYASRRRIVMVIIIGFVGLGFWAAWNHYKKRVQAGEDVDFLTKGESRLSRVV